MHDKVEELERELAALYARNGELAKIVQYNYAFLLHQCRLLVLARQTEDVGMVDSIITKLEETLKEWNKQL